MYENKSSSVKLFLRSLLGDNKKRIIGNFVIKKHWDGGISVFTKEGFKINSDADEKVKDINDKKARKEFWSKVHIEISEKAKQTQPSPISDDDLSDIEV